MSNINHDNINYDNIEHVAVEICNKHEFCLGCPFIECGGNTCKLAKFQTKMVLMSICELIRN